MGAPTRVPADLAVIVRDVGRLLTIAAGLMAVSGLVALAFLEAPAVLGFLLAAGITGLVGLGASRAFADAPEPEMKHGMVIAAGGWLAVALFGALPFLLTALLTPPETAATYVPAGEAYRSSLLAFRDPLHAVFESMSGWTGSGLTMASHEPSLPRAIQWWRSLTQWVGGVGVIVLTVSILSRPGSGSYTLFRSEAREEKIHPSIVSTVRTVWKIFLAFTLLAIAVLFVAIRLSAHGASLPLFEVAWQAINHAMTGLSTGGFSVTDDSIATYGSPLVETVLLPIMTLGAIAFPIHYAVFRDRSLRHWRADVQTRWLFVLLVVGALALSLLNLLPVAAATDAAIAGVPAPVRDSVFQWVSALTCTGFQSAPIGEWADGGKMVLAVPMILGGAAGSTVGGIKIIRGYLIGRGIRWQFRRVFLPDSAVITARVGERSLDRGQMEREFGEAAIVTLLWLGLLGLGSVIMVTVAPAEFGFADAFFEVASAQGNVGLSTGITGPEMPQVAEGMLVLNMWIGRLEIIPVLVFLRAGLKGLAP